MKLMMITRGSLIDKCSSFLTVSGGNTSLEIVDGILQQLKAKLTEPDLFETLEKNFIHGYVIKSLLKKLDFLDVPNDVVNFVVAFGSLFKQIIVDLQRRHEA